MTAAATVAIVRPLAVFAVIIMIWTWRPPPSPATRAAIARALHGDICRLTGAIGQAATPAEAAAAAADARAAIRAYRTTGYGRAERADARITARRSGQALAAALAASTPPGPPGPRPERTPP